VINGSFVTGYGGTSFATPRWAGFLALVNQQSVANGHGTVGFINPALYSLGTSSSYSSAMHDITSGSNPPTSGTGGGFSAVPGYDLVTGWGSPAGASLINALAGSSTKAGTR
jgi:xanthomonalisin